jgi:hypothetical protein
MPKAVKRFDVTHPGIRQQSQVTVCASNGIKKFWRRRWNLMEAGISDLLVFVVAPSGAGVWLEEMLRPNDRVLC